MANFSKILGLASTALVFAAVAFGQNTTCTGGVASQTPLVRVEGTTELVGEYSFTCTANGLTGTANILDILSLPVTSKALATSGTIYTEAVAVINNGSSTPIVQGTISGSQVSFSGINIPASGVTTITIANIRVNATSLTVGTAAPPSITESAFISGANLNSTVTTSAAVAYAFTGLSPQKTSKKYPYSSSSSGANTILVCQGYKSASSTASTGLLSTIDVGENFATAFKGVGSSANNSLGSEFSANTETGFVPASFPSTSATGISNIANSATLIQVVFSNVPGAVTLYLPITVAADQSLGSTPTAGTGTLTLVASPSNLTTATASTSSSAPSFTQPAPPTYGTATGYSTLSVSSGAATAYYLFLPGPASNSVTETFQIPVFDVQTANTVTASSTAMTAAVSFAPVGSTQIPNFVVGPSTTSLTLSSFSLCTTSLMFPFVTNQLGFDTGIAIANTSADPFGSNGATAQAGTCQLNFYGSGAPSPANITTANIPSGTVYAGVLSGLAAGFQGYIIAQCQFQYAHAFAFITDGVGANGGLSQGYLAGVIPDTNQLSRGVANPIGVATAGMAETLGN